MRKLKIYFDTSVINFLFAEDAPEKMEITHEYFDWFVKRKVYDHYVSAIVVDEIEKTEDIKHKENLLKVIKEYDLIELSLDPEDEIIALANQYLIGHVVPDKKLEDALHVALATIHGIDVLLSWNYRHLANINKEKKFEIINLKNGYSKTPRLCSPMEVFNEK